MARLQLIFPLLLWAVWRESATAGDWQPVGPWAGLAIYLAALGLLVAMVFRASRLTMRRTTYDRPAAVPRFHRALFFARWMVLLLHAFALWGLSYGLAVLRIVPDFGRHFDSLPAFASMLPILLAWIGMLWAQYPLDRGVQEQNALFAVELGEPVRAPPTRRTYLWHAFRSQVLFTLAPLMAIALLRDGLALASLRTGVIAPDHVDWIVTAVAVLIVFTLAPELLRRVLPTEPLPASPVRTQLMALSKRLRLGVRDVLLWHTYHTMGNAAVMGVVPGVRYVLISDLLLEAMSPDQLEAVFAHEAGHVVHKHIAWYVAYWLAVMMTLQVAGTKILEWAIRSNAVDMQTARWVVEIGGLILAIALFGLLSRAFERQADTFAARRLTRPATDADGPRNGTQVFISSLAAVARLNNLPMDARSMTAGRPLLGRIVGRLMHHASTWLHGSIRSRMDHLTRLSDSPAAARRFDQTIIVVKSLLLITLMVAGVMTFLQSA